MMVMAYLGPHHTAYLVKQNGCHTRTELGILSEDVYFMPVIAAMQY